MHQSPRALILYVIPVNYSPLVRQTNYMREWPVVVGYCDVLVRHCSIFSSLGLNPRVYLFIRLIPIIVAGTGLAYTVSTPYGLI